MTKELIVYALNSYYNSARLFFFFLKPSAKALAEDLFYFFVAQHKEQILDK